VYVLYSTYRIHSVSYSVQTGYLEQLPSQLGVPFRLSLHVLLVGLHRLFLLLSIVLLYDRVGGDEGEGEEWEVWVREGGREKWGGDMVGKWGRIDISEQGREKERHLILSIMYMSAISHSDRWTRNPYPHIHPHS
jgi:hypothetical protein